MMPRLQARCVETATRNLVQQQQQQSLGSTTEGLDGSGLVSSTRQPSEAASSLSSSGGAAGAGAVSILSSSTLSSSSSGLPPLPSRTCSLDSAVAGLPTLRQTSSSSSRDGGGGGGGECGTPDAPGPSPRSPSPRCSSRQHCRDSGCSGGAGGGSANHALLPPSPFVSCSPCSVGVERQQKQQQKRQEAVDCSRSFDAAAAEEAPPHLPAQLCKARSTTLWSKVRSACSRRRTRLACGVAVAAD